MIIFYHQHFLIFAQNTEIDQTLGLELLFEKFIQLNCEGVECEEEVDHFGEESLSKVRHTANRQKIVEKSQIPKLNNAKNKERTVKHIQVGKNLSDFGSYQLNIWLNLMDNLLLRSG